jgi:hypothetical protein
MKMNYSQEDNTDRESRCRHSVTGDVISIDTKDVIEFMTGLALLLEESLHVIISRHDVCYRVAERGRETETERKRQRQREKTEAERDKEIVSYYSKIS